MRKMLTQFFRYCTIKGFSMLLVMLVVPVTIMSTANMYANENLQQEKKKITGKITEGLTGEPLPGVSILIKGTTEGTITDIDGNYTIMASTGDLLVFSFMGYLAEEVIVGDQSTIDIALAADIVGLDEVVVIGYGTQKKSDLTGSIASISAKDIQAVPVTRIDEALEGRAAGVNVTAATGMPGGSRNIQIRGVSSINGYNPLIIVDGIPGGDLNKISPSDVESFEILKDAASTAIYGSNGGNGVIIITTKRGKPGKITTSLNMYRGVQSITKKIPLMNTEEWSKFYVAKNGEPFNFAEEGQDPTINTDWQDEVYKPASLFDCDFSISGGTEKSTFKLGAEYLKQEGIIKNTGYEKVLVNFGSTSQIAKHIKIDEKIRLISDKTTGPAEWQYQNVYNNFTSLPTLMMLPFVTPYDENGKWSTITSLGAMNPFTGIDKKSNQYGKNMGAEGTVGLIIDFLKAFTFTSRVGGSTGINESWNFQPEYYSWANDQNPLNKLTQNWRRNFSWNVQNYLTFQKTILNNHDVSLMVGQDAGRWWDYNIEGFRQDFTSEDPNLLYFDNSSDVSAAAQIIGGSAKAATGSAFFGRVNYAYKSMFLAQINYRKDGNSNFGPNYRWGTFKSYSAGFKFSELEAVKNLGFLNFGKIRAGWGETGQWSVSTYWPYASTILNTDIYNYSFNNQDLSIGMGPVQIPNPDLHWETVITKDIGLDLGFLQNQLNVSIEYSNKVNDGMIQPKAVNSLAGTYLVVGSQGAELGNTGITTTFPVVNYGTVSNKSLELTAEYKKQFGNLKVNIGGNFTYQKNVITDLATDSTVQGSVHDLSSLTVSKVGYSIGEFHGYQFERLFREGDRMVYNDKAKRMVFADQPFSINDAGDTTYAQPFAKPGDAKWVDLNGDGKINSNDYDYLGSYIPPIVIGFNFGLEYKGLELIAYINGVFGNEIFFGTRRYLVNWETSVNKGADFADRYHLPVEYDGVIVDPGNTNSDMPDIGAQNWGVPSTLYIESGSYVRLKALTLAYTIPNNLTSKVNIETFRLYVTAKNLLTLTRYPGYDPEISSSDPKVAGIDISGYPQCRTFTVGVNVTF